MRNLILLIFLLAACGTDKPREQQAESAIEGESGGIKTDYAPEAETRTEQQTNSDKKEPLDDSLFEFLDEPNSTRQTLSVKWISTDSVEFNLFTETDLCNYEQKGVAVSKEVKNTEIDENENGMAYPATEYMVVDGGKLWSLRIHKQERNRAKITYIYDKPRDECAPYDELMIKIPSNYRNE